MRPGSFYNKGGRELGRGIWVSQKTMVLLLEWRLQKRVERNKQANPYRSRNVGR